MHTDTFTPRYSNDDRARLVAQARAEAMRLRTLAMDDAWSATVRLLRRMVANMQRPRRAVSP